MRGARCDRSGCKSGEGSAGPEPKIATVERREASVPRTRDAWRLTSAWRVRTRRTGASQAPDALSALRPPLIPGARSKSKPRAQKTRRGNEEVLFEAKAFSSSLRPRRDSGEGRNP